MSKPTITTRSFENNFMSEVYRELERKAVKDGFFDETPTQTITKAAEKISVTSKITKRASQTYIPSDNLLTDISVLVDGLKLKGYVKQAEEIETNFIIYKQAEVELYGVSIDKAQDFIDFAHPEGDVDVIGDGDKSSFHTIESAAAKIRSMVNREPKKTSIAEIASLLKKKAQLPETQEELLNRTYNSYNEIISQFNLNTRDIKLSYDKLLDPAVLKAFSAITKQSELDVSNAYKRIEGLKAQGITRFDKAEIESLIRAGSSDSTTHEKAKTILKLVGLSPSLLDGINSLIVSSRNMGFMGDLKKIEKTFAANDLSFAADIIGRGFGWSGVSRPNDKSPYVQLLEVGHAVWQALMNKEEAKLGAKTIINKGYTVRNDITSAICDSVVAAYGKLFDICSQDKIETANNYIVTTAPSLVKNTLEELKAKIPQNAIAGDSVNATVALDGIYNSFNSIRANLKSLSEGSGVFGLLSTLDPENIKTQINSLINSLSTSVKTAESSFYKNSGSVNISDVITSLQQLKTKLETVAGNDNAERYLRTVNKYINKILGIGKSDTLEKPLMLFRTWLKSEGYKSKDDFQKDIDVLNSEADKIVKEEGGK